LYRPVPGAGGVLLDLDRRQFFALDGVATRMWEELMKTGTVDAALHALLAEYDVEPTVLERDLEEFVGTLLDRDLVRRVED
jgi:hypothetical protein